MIDVGVCDCDHPRGAELVRILINHPDVELKWVTGSNAGQPIARFVSGIVGECDLTLSSEGPLDEVDVVFLCQGRQHVDACLQALALPPTTRVIDLSGSHNLDTWSGGDWTYGMGEMQRRVLVHDAHHVAVPGNAAAVALLALMPMARNLLVNSPVKLEVEMGAAAFGDGPVLSTDPDGIPSSGGLGSSGKKWPWCCSSASRVSTSRSRCRSRPWTGAAGLLSKRGCAVAWTATASGNSMRNTTMTTILSSRSTVAPLPPMWRIPTSASSTLTRTTRRVCSPCTP
ncbi:MAG: hypothetical protein IJ879_02660 [Muribaculaceae bacterium]|nr:hypothetical protein [Muribaculaceae bacterium]